VTLHTTVFEDNAALPSEGKVYIKISSLFSHTVHFTREFCVAVKKLLTNRYLRWQYTWWRYQDVRRGNPVWYRQTRRQDHRRRGLRQQSWNEWRWSAGDHGSSS